MFAHGVLTLMLTRNTMLLMCLHDNDAVSGCRDADCKVASSSTMAKAKLTGMHVQPCGIHSITSMSMPALCNCAFRNPQQLQSLYGVAFCSAAPGSAEMKMCASRSQLQHLCWSNQSCFLGWHRAHALAEAFRRRGVVLTTYGMVRLLRASQDLLIDGRSLHS